LQHGLYILNGTRLEEQQKGTIFPTNREIPVGPYCSYSLVGSLWSTRMSCHVGKHQSRQITTH